MLSARLALIAALLLAAVSGGCNSDERMIQPPVVSDVLVIRSGTMMVNCLGYCSLEVAIEPGSVFAISTGRDSVSNPPRLRRSETTAAEWDDLVAAVDLDYWMHLDTAKGGNNVTPHGVEWVEIETRDMVRMMIFNYGDSVDEIQPLLQKIRLVRARVAF